jgi:hypothetical protein
VLIAVGGPGLVYALDAATYAVLVVVLAMIRIERVSGGGERRSVIASIVEGAAYVRSRPLIYTLMGLDLSATVFSAYRVLLPALALDILHVGPQGYGLLSSAPSAGALLATYTIFRVVGKSRRLGRVLLVSLALYGVSAILLAQAPVFGLALLAALLLGAFDAMATTIRHAAVQIETPDELRGRVSAFYQMSSRGGPAIGDVVVGAAAGILGPITALTLGGIVPAVIALGYLSRPNRVRDYAGVADDEPAAENTEDVVPPAPDPVSPRPSAKD